MIDGRVVVDAHVHAAATTGLKLDRHAWLHQVKDAPSWGRAYDPDGRVVPAALDELFADEGVDVALLFCEYSPKVTGIQAIEDMLPIVEHNPARFRVVANVNPHLHYPIATELVRQLDLGAVALKVHPVHGGFAPDDKMLYPAYAVCEERGVPVVVHTGPSTFPGATSHYGDPTLLIDVLRDFPGLSVVLAHGGRGWWYDAAAFLALNYDTVWIDLAGLPPRKLPEYYRHFDLARLARRWIFGTDWPASPGAARNATTLASLGLPEQILDGVLGGNAIAVYPGLAPF